MSLPCCVLELAQGLLGSLRKLPGLAMCGNSGNSKDLTNVFSSNKRTIFLLFQEQLESSSYAAIKDE